MEMQQQLHENERIQTCSDIVQHDPETFWETLDPADREGLGDIEYTKKYKSREEASPVERCGDESDHLACNFVDHDLGRILFLHGPRNASGGWDAGQGYNGRGKYSIRQPLRRRS
jgi:hypothetical protein